MDNRDDHDRYLKLIVSHPMRHKVFLLPIVGILYPCETKCYLIDLIIPNFIIKKQKTLEENLQGFHII